MAAPADSLISGNTVDVSTISPHFTASINSGEFPSQWSLEAQRGRWLESGAFDSRRYLLSALRETHSSSLWLRCVGFAFVKD